VAGFSEMITKMNEERLISREAADIREPMDKAVADKEYERAAQLLQRDPGIAARLMIAPRLAQALTDHVYKVKTDLDQSVATAKEFLRVGPATARSETMPGGSCDLEAAAKYLAVSVLKLRTLCRNQQITHTRPDYRTYVFRRDDLDEFLNRYRVQRKSVYD